VANRRFPPPWSIEQLDACFVVQDASSQKLGYFYFEDEPGRPIGGQTTREGGGATDRCQRRKVAGAVA
jgi:hypothetical protein